MEEGSETRRGGDYGREGGGVSRCVVVNHREMENGRSGSGGEGCVAGVLRRGELGGLAL